MIQEEKFEKLCGNFLKLSEEQQDYILGILQALVFAKTVNNKPASENPSDSDNPKTDKNQP